LEETTFLPKKYGLGTLFKKSLNLRFELKLMDIRYIDAIDIHEVTLQRLSQYPAPARSNVKRRAALYIFIYFIVKNYRGWRYVRCLPINGQRTWSNRRTAGRCNVLLKKLLLKRGRKYYGNMHITEIYTAMMAELVNIKWQEHWYTE